MLNYKLYKILIFAFILVFSKTDIILFLKKLHLKIKKKLLH